MKRLITLVAAILMTASVWAQSPEKMSYQAVVRNSSDALVATQALGMQISILQGGATGTPVYVETQTPTTNANGLVTIEIGTGTLVSGDFTTIDWANDTYFIQTETDPTGGTTYTITGTSQLMSVPYALHSKTADNIVGGITETDPIYTASEAANITAADITNLSNLSGTNTGDQTIIRTGTTVKLTNGGTFTDSVNTYTAGTNITISASNVISATGGSSLHYVGELFGGGIVFYVYNNGANGLIASLDDLDGGSGVAWSGNTSTLIGATAQSFYDGAANTTAMVTQDATPNKAGTLCDSYTGGSQTDWYLPASWELNLLYNSAFSINTILENDGNGTTNGFNIENVAPTYGRYWSSTEFGSYFAWSYNFGYGVSDNFNKSSTYGVRAVRAF
jgi:hypothetical protein